MKNIDPIITPTKAKAHTPPYKVHKYFARRPYNVFRNLIDYYSNPKDIILDVFCGGGVSVYEGLTINRKVVGVDLNPLATFISEMQIQQVDPKGFDQFAFEIVEELEAKYQFVYSSANKMDSIAEWTEWAYKVTCPHCKNDIVLVEENKIRNGIYKCSNQECSKGKLGVKRTDCKPNGSVAIRVKMSDGTVKRLSNIESDALVIYIEQIQNEIISHDMILIDKDIPKEWDRTHEDKLIEKGIYSFQDFFTKRNYALNIAIFNTLLKLKMEESVSKQMNDLLYFTFSASLRHTNNMTRVTDNWENGNPTSMDKHAYWLPNQYVETNIFHQWKKKITAVVKALEFNKTTLKNQKTKFSKFSHLEQASEGYMLLNQSSSELPIPDNSIDVVITDPPYGSNVQYNELSSFWNIWYEAYTGKPIALLQEKEAVMNRKKNIAGSKSLNHYEEMLFQVFKECFRVLKEEGYLVFTFNNKNVKVWFALLRAAARAGFELPLKGVLFQDYIDSYKNTSHLRFEGNVQGDFIYSFRRKADEVKVSEREVTKVDLDMQLKNLLKETVNRMFEIKDKYDTAELYQGVFSSIVHFMMDIAILTLTDESIVKEIEAKSDQYIDQLLKSQLRYKDDFWYLKEDNLVCTK